MKGNQLLFFPNETLQLYLNVTSPARAARSFKFYHSFTPFSVAACGPGPRISKAASKFLVMLASSLGRRLMFA